MQGQLPFDTKAMDTPVPLVDFSPTGAGDSSYDLQRPDVNGRMRYHCHKVHAMLNLTVDFMAMLDDLERFARENSDDVALKSVQEARSGLEKLIAKMDSLESGFDRIAERSCKFATGRTVSVAHAVPVLSSSRLLEHRRRSMSLHI